MPSQQDVLLANATDALEQSQRYLVLAMASTALLGLLTLDAPRLRALHERIELPTVGKLDPDVAWIVLMLGYVGFGILANSALGRAKKCASQLHDSDLATACFSRFTLLTAESRLIRLLSAFLPGILFVIAYLAEAFRHQKTFDFEPVWGLLLGFLLILAPYIRLAGAVYEEPDFSESAPAGPSSNDA